MTRAQDPERRRRVLEAAAEVIVERGLPETRIADVARHASMSPGHVMYYFPTKSELILGALRLNEDRFYDAVTSELDALRPGWDRLLHLIESAVPEGPGDPYWSLWAETWAQAVRDPALASQLIELDARWLGLLATVISEGITGGVFDAAANAELTAGRITTVIDGLAVQVVIGAPGVDRALLLAECLSEAERYLGPRR